MSAVDILNRGRECIRSEARSLEIMADKLDKNFTDVVQLLQAAKGRIIFTGIGKNQFIGRKIAATLSSIGTPSLFMHAGDAIHGDLGMIANNDIVICLSKSGNTAEIQALLPLLQNTCTAVVGFTTVAHSYLAKHAAIPLIFPIEEEACPLGLTPTNSSTAFLALGDAIAMTLLEQKAFSKDDFARFHPGGSLGKKLYLRVKDLSILNEKPAVQKESSLQDAIVEISKKRLGCSAVLEGDDLVGIITDGDLRRVLEKSVDINNLLAADAMVSSPKTIHPDAFATEALQKMRANNITQLIVTENEHYLGIIHIHDILKEGIV